MHEAKMHEHNVFLTLTYNDDSLPQFGSLEVSHFQKFMKRLRKARNGQKIRYFHCGEYGEKYDRPHYHALLFGVHFSDQYPWERKNGHTYYRSPELERLWPFGFSSIGSVTWDSAAYVARYIFKKQYGEHAGRKPNLDGVDYFTGEHFAPLKDEYATMSRRPGIGEQWYKEFGWTDCHRDDFIIFDGKRYKPPRYYDALLEKADPKKYEALKRKRRAKASEESPDQTPERLETREYCLAQRTRKLVRNFEDGSSSAPRRSSLSSNA